MSALSGQGEAATHLPLCYAVRVPFIGVERVRRSSAESRQPSRPKRLWWRRGWSSLPGMLELEASGCRVGCLSSS